MKKTEFDCLECEANAHHPYPMAHKVVHLTQKDLMDIVEQERREQEPGQGFDAFYPLSYSNHINF